MTRPSICYSCSLPSWLMLADATHLASLYAIGDRSLRKSFSNSVSFRLSRMYAPRARNKFSALMAIAGFVG